MTEPTDAELDAVLCNQWPAFSMQATLVRMWVRAAMRAAIAKWGTPPAVAREPVAWMGTHDKTDLYYRKPPQADVVPLYTTPQPTQAQAVNQADRPFIVRLAEDFAEECVTAGYVTTKAASYGRLMDEALSTQAQAGAEPLTDEQIEAESPKYYVDDFLDFKAGVRFAERAHGISTK